ncbi:SDR family oxidoreductase [Candidatus Thioglobus sp.]|jgi:uncharacterized protein|nr:SDR family oxidoreductase [Candidatus Thioglobus sp.]
MKKCIVITGVTSGLGKGIAKSFSLLGWLVIGLARNETKLKGLERDLGGNFHGIQCDVQLIDSVKNAFNNVLEYSPFIDLLVNNAAVFKMAKFSECDYEDIDAMIDTNLKGAIYVTLESIKYMGLTNYSRSSRIVNIASVAAKHGIAKQAIYCASKYGLDGFSEALNQEIIQDGIFITTLYPGGINTPLWNDNNPYPVQEDVSNILQISDVVNVVEYISQLHERVVLKSMTIFPKNEWH